MTYGSNADTAYAEWQDRADRTPEDEPLDWRESRRIDAETERVMRRRKPLDAQAWAKLNLNPWAEV